MILDEFHKVVVRDLEMFLPSYMEAIATDPKFDPIPESPDPWVVRHSYTVQED